MSIVHPCPRDHAPLATVAERGIRMGSCGSCGGLWVPMSQLAPRLSNVVSARLFQTSGGRDTLLRCPVDGMPMREIEIGGVHIDRCTSCRGLWFDAGELATVLAATGFVAPRRESETGEWQDVAEGAAHVVGDGILQGVGEGLFDGVGDVLSAIAEFIAGAISF